MLRTINLSRDFGGTPVLVNINLAIDAGHKYGLIGRNGCGKTTLVKILAGLDEDFRGTLKTERSINVSLVEQKAPEFFQNESCTEFLLRELRALEAQLDEAVLRMAELGAGKAALEEYGKIRELYDNAGGNLAEEAARKLLARIGLEAQADNPATSLSGGEKNLLALARALLSRPDLLILDEPGNHLDMAGLAWLEDFLKSFPCTMIIVSHDRRLLDQTVDSIIEMDAGEVTVYKGNYSQYRLERLKRAASQGQTWKADQQHIARLEALVKKFAEIARSRPDPAWGKRLRARRSQLERVKAEAEVQPNLGNLKAKIVFDGEKSAADLALVVEAYNKQFGDMVLLENSAFTLLNGDRAALLGPNGCGKTSFLRDLVHEGSWENPNLRVGPSMRVGYCAQQQEVFNPDDTVEAAFLKILSTPAEVLKHLSRFLFSYQDLQKRIGSMSGGELNRLQFARASAQKANFLVLDEPTNHLDIPSREAIEDALDEFEGTILVVSHDRYFIDKVADRVIFIRDKRMNEYEGSFSEYWRDIGRNDMLAQLEVSGSGKTRAFSDAGLNTGGTKAKTDGAAQELASSNVQHKMRNAQLETRITEMEKQKETLERKIAEAIQNGAYAKAKELAKELESHGKLLASLWSQL